MPTPKLYYDVKGKPVYIKEDFPNPADFQKAAEADLSARMAKMPDATPKKAPSFWGDSVGASGSLGNSLKTMSRTAANFLPAAGGILGALVPGAGETGLSEAGGGIAGSIALQKLRQSSPEWFGAPSNNPVASAILDGVTQGAFGGGIRTLGKGAGAMLGKYGGGLKALANTPEVTLDKVLPDAIKNLFPQKMLPLTRGAGGRFQPAKYAPNIPHVEVLGNLLRALFAGSTVPPDSSATQNPQPSGQGQ